MRLSIFPLAIVSMLFAVQASANDTIIHVIDSAGNPLENAVVYAEAPGLANTGKPGSAEIEQKDKKFIPLVSVIQTGTSVAFPNNDKVKHHAYSFSAPKQFELKLYSGKPSAPVLFDKPGTVVIGCNIHDQMVAYIHVVNTPYFAKTDVKGVARLNNLPTGKYTLKAWHYLQAPGAEIKEQVLQVGAENAPLTIRLNVKAS